MKSGRSGVLLDTAVSEHDETNCFNHPQISWNPPCFGVAAPSSLPASHGQNLRQRRSGRFERVSAGFVLSCSAQQQTPLPGCSLHVFDTIKKCAVALLCVRVRQALPASSPTFFAASTCLLGLSSLAEKLSRPGISSSASAPCTKHQPTLVRPFTTFAGEATVDLSTVLHRITSRSKGRRHHLNLRKKSHEHSV